MVWAGCAPYHSCHAGSLRGRAPTVETVTDPLPDSPARDKSDPGVSNSVLSYVPPAGVRWGVTVEAGKHVWSVVVLRYGGSISGGVTTSAGIAARNAQVTAVGGWSNKTYRTWTNNSGRYELGGLPTGEYTVTYRLGGLATTLESVHIDAQYAALPWSVLTGMDVIVQ